MNPTKSHLYSIPWKPFLYPTGLHHLKVAVTDALSQRRSHSQQFSLDGTVEPLKNYSRWILLGPLQQIIVWGFVVADLIVVIFLIAIRRTPTDIETRPQNGRLESLKVQFLCRCLQFKQCELLYNAMLVTWSSLMILPWFMGKISSPEHYGMMFLWGIVHLYKEAPNRITIGGFATMDTHLYAGFQMVNFISTFLFLFFLSGSTNHSVIQARSRKSRAFILIVAYIWGIAQVRHCYSIVSHLIRTYEWYSIIFSPLVAWYNSLIALYLIYFLFVLIVRSLSVPPSPVPTTLKDK